MAYTKKGMPTEYKTTGQIFGPETLFRSVVLEPACKTGLLKRIVGEVTIHQKSNIFIFNTITIV